jgi:hypothetical protein
MPLIWGNRQYRRVAADWRDGQFAHDAHAYFARRATVRRSAQSVIASVCEAIQIKKSWIASSLPLLAMAIIRDLTEE